MKKMYSQSPFNFTGENRDYVLKIITKLHKVRRRGWVDRGIKNSETVGEHTEELINLAKSYYPFIPGLTKMLKIHDWPETDEKLGDIRTDNFCPEDHRWSKEKKYEAELRAMEKICSKLGSGGKKIMQLWLEFEEEKTDRAKIARELDKLQAIKKAIQYETQGETVIAQEFIDHDGAKITKPELIKILDKSKLRLKQKTLV